ncbi:zinc finger protein 732-like [Wyeomyia smithii]|uniref:zinc finger protein 732-like n=1 Tax=Wyeomyia smithii TaxID=174621 RepID=UPI002467B68C|nr:zinc finger protein 732-like [Wyeomyia smithii]
MEKFRPIKIEELMLFDAVPAEKKTSVDISDRSRGETSVTNAVIEGSTAMNPKPTTNTTDEIVTTAAYKKVKASRTSWKPGKRPRKRCFACEICNITVSTPERLHHHMSAHTGDRNFQYCPYKCPNCDRKLETYALLVDHRRIHSDERPFVCEICNACYKRPKALKRHMRKIHEVDPYPRNVESLEPTRTDNNRTHNCDICGKQYIEKRSLRLHLLHHQSTVLPQCEICNKGFRSVYILKKHQKTHETKLSCDVCDKTFTRVFALNVHKGRHGGERKLKCEICGKAFFHRTPLGKHLKTHSGKLPQFVINEK